MALTFGRIGIDIGAVFIKAVRIDNSQQIENYIYRPHKGNPARALEKALAELQVTSEDRVGMTGSAAGMLAETLGVPLLDLTQCQINASLSRFESASTIIDIGGGSATLVQLDDQGRFQNHATNSLCAAGTGSFLDEQAERLGISYKEMKAFQHIDSPPTIATRCSVFAKSDLIHRQQEGYSKAAMWSGLCKGMTRTLLQTLLNGKPLDGPTVVIGGVAQNLEVLRWLKTEYPEYILVPEDPHLVAASGAAEKAQHTVSHLSSTSKVAGNNRDKNHNHSWSLSIKDSVYPSFETVDNFVDHENNEVRVVKKISSPTGSVACYLGIDIGSTSTKLAIIDQNNEVLVDIYRKTGGAPIDATKYLFRALQRLGQKLNVSFDIQGVGTTGSGRKMVGKVIGADSIINEISAHVAGAVHTDPSVDTIFEIGGQDSKYMHVIDGHIRDANMNYVCAAGTGSFVEEQANKLGYAVDKVGQAVLGLSPPRTSDRCTVFMEQDVTKLVQAGSTPEEALAGVMVSVVKNYLNKVVGNRHRSRQKIFFQGATARNPGLVAAFENLLEVQMVVSPYCHVMGAYGVALLTKQAIEKTGEQTDTRTSFRGLDLDSRSISIRKEVCELCQNNCSISFAEIEGLEDTPSWGYMCGRDPEEQRVKVNPNEKPLRLRQKLWRQAGRGVEVPENAPVVGIPQSLTTYTYLPLWQRFFNRLGFNIKLSGPTTEKIRTLGTQLCGADFCFPAKMSIGHVASLALSEGVDFIFMPHMVSEQQNPATTAAKFCPYVQGAPSFIRTALQLNGIDAAHLLSPVIDIRLMESKTVGLLARVLAGPLNKSRREIRAAWRDGLATQRAFEKECQAEGTRIISQAKLENKKLILLAGRPYNNFDKGLNLGLPQKLAEYGRMVIPLDMLAVDMMTIGERYKNTFWNYGQKLLAGIQHVADDDSMDAVYLTNFNCGPDSFLLSYAEEILGNRPFLALELDEHGADAGYLTRIEAFFDVLNKPRKKPSARVPFRPTPSNIKDRILWIPPMQPLAGPFLSAAFRRYGQKSLPLAQENQESFEIGRALTRGSECLPTSLTIGTFIKSINDHKGPEKHVLFMPTAEGPCRFGQYCTLHRQILDREGYHDAEILSPSSFNSYQGVEEPVRRYGLKALMIADVIYKAVCKTRPYEVNPGQTNRVLKEEEAKMVKVLESGGDILTAISEAVEAFAAIPTSGKQKPLVGIVGEIYIRCNVFANENVIEAVERFGGEAWLAPISEWILYTAATQNISFKDRSNNLFMKWLANLKNIYLFSQEEKVYQAAGKFLADRHEPDVRDVIEEGCKLMPIQFEGEAILTAGRAIKFAEQGASMVVNCAPFGCMPGTLTTALFRKIAPEVGIPMISMFYDGHGNQNQRLEVFLNNSIKDKVSAEHLEIEASRESQEHFSKSW
jgi:predicted CoA-substrate-specific enzyme activase